MAITRLNNNSITSITALPSGVGVLTEVDQWRVTTSFANASNGVAEIVSSNWERADTVFDKIGTGLSQSSGIFTFPSTGSYLINAVSSYYPNGANSDVRMSIRVTTDNSSYNTRAEAISGAAGADRPEMISVSCIVDVTDTSNVKFAIYTSGTTSTNFWRADTGQQRFGFTCVKLGNT